ncbi:hypothetical protein [Mesorhizobium amorphae]|uniref:hypothetical protein n=1 Tax=Mesorhizobium amorphae TaxID=71433 RepID=UPI003D66EF5F
MSDRDLRRLFDPPVEQAAPYTCITTQEFLLQFGLETLRNLPEGEALDDAGLLSRHGDTADNAYGPDKGGRSGWPIWSKVSGMSNPPGATVSQPNSRRHRELFLKTADQTEVVERWCFLNRPIWISIGTPRAKAESGVSSEPSTWLDRCRTKPLPIAAR